MTLLSGEADVFSAASTAEMNVVNHGTTQAIIARNAKQEGEAAMQDAADLMAGKTLPKTTMTELKVIEAGDTATAEKYDHKADCM